MTIPERRPLTDRICERCDFAIQRVRWFERTWDAAGWPAGGQAIEAGYRCAITRELVGRTDSCERFRYARGSSRDVEAF